MSKKVLSIFPVRCSRGKLAIGYQVGWPAQDCMLLPLVNPSTDEATRLTHAVARLDCLPQFVGPNNCMHVEGAQAYGPPSVVFIASVFAGYYYGEHVPPPCRAMSSMCRLRNRCTTSTVGVYRELPKTEKLSDIGEHPVSPYLVIGVS